ncbi:hypothetical protein ACK3Z8_00830 [Aeromonas caviae]
MVGTQFKTSAGNILTIVAISPDSKRKPVPIVECSVCSKDRELWPDDFTISLTRLSNGKIPCGCAPAPRWTEKQCDVKARRQCEKFGLEYIGFTSGFKNVGSKIEFVCHKHGRKEIQYYNFMHKETLGCQDCGNDSKRVKQLDPNAYDRVIEKCNKHDYTFLGFANDTYSGKLTKLKYECKNHGVIETTFARFIHHDNNCPSCSFGGYNPNIPGNIYLFRHHIKGSPPVFKFGITNRNPHTRGAEHIAGISKSKVISSELISCKRFSDGNIPQKIEQYIKRNFICGVTDKLTSGNTETISGFSKYIVEDFEDITSNHENYI